MSVKRDALSPPERLWLGTDHVATEQIFQAHVSCDGPRSSAGHGADTGAGQGVGKRRPVLVRWSTWVDASHPGRMQRVVLI